MATAFVPHIPIVPQWAGEVEDVSVNWIDRMRYSANGTGSAGAYGVSATGANGSGWSAIGESASSFAFHIPAGWSGLLSSMNMFWGPHVTATANGSIVTSSALTGVTTTLRLSATAAAALDARFSASLRTSSGRELREVWTGRIQG